MQTEMRTLNGQPFFIRRWGNPELPVLLMLHGFPEYGGAWQNLAQALQDRYHCIAPDQRGFGQSWAPEGVRNYTTAALVSDMVALIEQLGGPVTVMGHDWGAAVAYGLAMFQPHLVDRLIITNGVHPVPFQRAMAAGGAQSEASQYIHALRAPTAAADLSENDFTKLERFFRHGMGTDWLDDVTLAAYKTEWARPGRLDAMLNWYRASPLKIAAPGKPLTDLPELPLDRLKVPQPHLLIWGDADTALLPETTRGLEDFAPKLTRKTIAGADHWLCHQYAEEVAEIIQQWAAD